MAVAISIKVIIVAICLIVAGALVGVIFYGTATAEDMMDDVATSLRGSVADNAKVGVLKFLKQPFEVLRRMVEKVELGMVNVERWDAYGAVGRLGALHHMMTTKKLSVGFSGTLYIGNEYGHFMGVNYVNEAEKLWEVKVAPPLDQIIEGHPSWTIPCRYQRGCNNASGWCLPLDDPWGRSVKEAETPPYWVQGRGTWKNADVAAAYAANPADPAWATWAVSQNPTSISATTCRDGAVGPKPPCPDKQACVEFNRTVYMTGDVPTWSQYVSTRSDYDTRGRTWYVESSQLPRDTAFYADIYLCAQDMLPCLTATLPVYVALPAVGAAVRWTTSSGQTETGVVERYTHTLEEMHTPVVRRDRGGATVVVSRNALELVGPVGTYPQVMEDRLIGVMATDYFSDTLQELVDSIQVAKTGSVLIAEMTPSALLIVSGFDCEAKRKRMPGEVVQCFVRKLPNGKGERVSAFDPYSGEVPHGVMTALYDPVWDEEQGKYVSDKIVGTRAEEDHTVRFGGEAYWVRVVPFLEEDLQIKKLNWLAVVVIPQDDYLATVRERQTVSLVVTVCMALAVLGVLVVLAVLFFVRPITQMAADFHLACTMQLDELHDNPPTSAIKEISYLQRAFLILVGNLRMYRSFLPHSCLGAGIDDDDEGETDDGSVSAPSAEKHSDKKANGSNSKSSNSSKDTMHGKFAPAAVQGWHLKRRNIAIVSLNVVGFQAVVRERSEEVRALHAQYIEAVMDEVGQRGVAEPFSGDRMVVSYNAASQCVSYRESALMAAWKLTRPGACFAGRTVHAGVAFSDALCGNLGTSRMKKFGMLGRCYPVALGVCLLNKHYETKALVCCSSSEGWFSEFEVRFVDVITIPKEGSRRKRLYEVTDHKERVECEEWMYQMDSESKEVPTNVEWEKYLTSDKPCQVDDFQDPRIQSLVKQGKIGISYVGTDPGFFSIL